MLPRSIATKRGVRATRCALDIAMGGSTNTVLHLLAAAHEAGVDFTHGRHRRDLAAHARASARSRRTRRSTTWRTCTAPAASPRSSASWTAAGCSTRPCTPSTPPTSTTWLADWDIRGGTATRRGDRAVPRRARAASGPPRRSRSTNRWDDARHRRRGRLHPRRRARLHRRRRPGDPAAATSPPTAAIVKTAGVPEDLWTLPRPGAGLRVPGGGRRGDPRQAHRRAGDVVVVRYEGPKGGPGMQEMLYPTSYLKGRRASARRAR